MKSPDHLSILANFQGERHEHLWGYELWLENNEKYCSKLLIVNEGYESSWHYHKKKDETFMILEGQVELIYAKDPNSDSNSLNLSAGEKFRLIPGIVHSFKSLKPRSVVLEVSTTDDLDNVKLRPARKL